MCVCVSLKKFLCKGQKLLGFFCPSDLGFKFLWNYYNVANMKQCAWDFNVVKTKQKFK